MTTIGVLVKAPGFIVFGALLLLLILAKGALADGAYQRTDDRKKTLVWNNNPKPDDTATWSGGRDAEGYATGPGTLQWFRTDRSFTTGSNVFSPKKTLISSYSGTMVHGKFSGGVMTVDHGTTYHATFVDGHNNGRWTAGPVVTKAESAEPAAAAEKPERTASATSTEVASESSKTKKISEEKTQPRVAEETSADIPAAGPEESEVSGQRSEVSKSATASEEPEQSATPRAPVTRKAALAPGAVRAIEHPTHAVAKKSETEPARRSDRAKPEQTEKSSKIAKAASSQPSKAKTQLSEDIPAEGPLSAGAEKAQSPSSKSAIAESSQPSTLNAQGASNETPVDNSLRTLTGPPSSLHLRTPPETNPPAQISTPPIAAVSSPTAGAKLTAVQAMDIADIEARTKGYDLGEYQLPKAEYNAASDTWSVTYVARDAGKAAKKLSVTIQDKTGKAEVKK
ncbi:MAG: hypothetical protein DME28_00330 [Verrucomicrobia bacterium]|nr:MAG: hypothetical protein DME28_00330 [Verrucomicrobiota bacterium]